jgi:hypothetical protein
MFIDELGGLWLSEPVAMLLFLATLFILAWLQRRNSIQLSVPPMPAQRVCLARHPVRQAQRQHPVIRHDFT